VLCRSFLHFPWVGQGFDEFDDGNTVAGFFGVCFFAKVSDLVVDEFSLASTDLVEYFTEVDDVADVVGHWVCPLLVVAVAAVTAGEDAVSANVAEVDVLLAFVALDWFAVVE
jgi:hypothetical protein